MKKILFSLFIILGLIAFTMKANAQITFENDNPCALTISFNYAPPGCSGTNPVTIPPHNIYVTPVGCTILSYTVTDGTNTWYCTIGGGCNGPQLICDDYAFCKREIGGFITFYPCD